MTVHTLYADANVGQRAMRRFAASRAGAWLFARILPHLDRRVFRLTRGRHTLASAVSGLPIVMLTTTGRRTGRPRTVPVLGMPAAGGVAVVAGNFGGHPHPGWYYNLRADPIATVSIGATTQHVRAVEATGERRAQLIRDGMRIYPGWPQYERRAAHRRIAVFVLEPLAEA